jgi:hypothetical protein
VPERSLRQHGGIVYGTVPTHRVREPASQAGAVPSLSLEKAIWGHLRRGKGVTAVLLAPGGAPGGPDLLMPGSLSGVGRDCMRYACMYASASTCRRRRFVAFFENDVVFKISTQEESRMMSGLCWLVMGVRDVLRVGAQHSRGYTLQRGPGPGGG